MTIDDGVGLATFALCGVGFFASPRGTARRLLRPSQRRWRAIVRPRLLLGLFTFYAGASFVDVTVATYWAQQIPQQAVERDLAAGKITLVGAALLVLVMGPPIEELLFRGYALRVARWLRPAPVALLSCLLFGLGHDDVLSASAMGLIFLFLRTAGRSLRPAIAVHVLRNALAMSLIAGLSLAAEKGWLVPQLPPEPFSQSLGDTVAGVAFGCILLALGWRAFARAVRFVLRSRMWRELERSTASDQRHRSTAPPADGEAAAAIAGSRAAVP